MNTFLRWCRKDIVCTAFLIAMAAGFLGAAIATADWSTAVLELVMLLALYGVYAHELRTLERRLGRQITLNVRIDPTPVLDAVRHAQAQIDAIERKAHRQ